MKLFRVTKEILKSKIRYLSSIVNINYCININAYYYYYCVIFLITSYSRKAIRKKIWQ